MSKRLTNRNKEMPSLTAENQHFWLNVYHRLAKFEDAEEKEGGTGAVDVVEVVRCKDCRFLKDDLLSYGTGYIGYCCHNIERQLMHDDDFCSCGER